jgi:elongation of very long chain fatty acids protein 4
MAILVYMFYMSKYVEFMDTIIMVLKRNMRQITFLHVYHHSSIALIWWIIAYHAPGGEGRTDCCNCCIATMEAHFVGR